MLGALGEASLESHGEHLGGDVVRVDELGVAEHLGLDAEQRVEFVALGLDLLGEFLGVAEGGERVGVGGGEELDLAGVGELFEEVDELGYVLLELLDGGAGDGD